MRGIGKPCNIAERIKKDHEDIHSLQEGPQPSTSLGFLLKHAFLGSCIYQHMWKYYPGCILYFQKCDMITSLKERDLVVNIHQFSHGTPWGKTFCVMSTFSPLPAKLEDIRRDSISASCHHCLSNPYSPNSFPGGGQSDRRKNVAVIAFFRETMSKINNVYRFNPNVSHKIIFQCLDV